VRRGFVDVLAATPSSSSHSARAYEFPEECGAGVCPPVDRPLLLRNPLISMALTLPPAFSAHGRGQPTGYAEGRVYGTDGDRLLGIDDRCLRTEGNCGIAWRGGIPGSIQTIELGDGVVYATTGDARVFAVPSSCGTAVTCEPTWWGALPSASNSGPLISGEMVFVPTSGGDIFAYSADCRADGGQCQPAWRGSTPGIVTDAVAVGRTVFVGIDTGNGAGGLVAFGLRSAPSSPPGDGRWGLVAWGGIIGAALVVMTRRFRSHRIR
jgi:putative pyrroloquinoline-quinone binding quinoprotein